MAIKKRGIPENLEVYVSGCVRYNGRVFVPLEELVALLNKVPKLNAGDLAKILENRQVTPSDALPILKESLTTVTRRVLRNLFQ